MLSSKLLPELGDIKGLIFDFELAGDVLPKHNHDEESAHVTIVTRGKIKAYSHDWEIEADAGSVVDFRAGEPHEIMAVEDNTRIINILKKYGGVMSEAPETGE